VEIYFSFTISGIWAILLHEFFFLCIGFNRIFNVEIWQQKLAKKETIGPEWRKFVKSCPKTKTSVLISGDFFSKH
jgi:hypothetical protein